MKKTIYLAAALIAATSPALAAYHTNQLIGRIQMPDSRPCVFFFLQGVSVADPVNPGDMWFTLPKSDPAYYEKMTTLVNAKLAGKTINVVTDGTISCGKANVLTVELP
jgi:hypothetical protein